MAATSPFDFVCTRLEEATSLDRLAARGTVRLALKESGLEARGVTPEQMAVVLDRVLPRELAARGVEEGESVCSQIRSDLRSLGSGAAADTPDAVFQRLGGA